MFAQVVSTEFIKLRRCKVTWFSLVAISLGPLAIALFMWIVREPGRAAQLGLLGTKANLSGLEATWPSYLSIMTLITGMGGMIILSFVVAYVFGREYAEGTAKNLLALPVDRAWFVLAKFLVIAVWWLVLVAAVLAEALLVGSALALPGFSAGLVWKALHDSLLTAAAAFLLAPMVAWITVLGRGYLPAIGFAFGMLALGDIFSHTGWATWFPWSVVPLFIGAVGKPSGTITVQSGIVMFATFAVGLASTVAQLRWADNAQ